MEFFFLKSSRFRPVKKHAMTAVFLRILLNFSEHLFYFFVLVQREEAVVRRCSSKKGFLKILQISQENIYVRVSFSYSCRPLGMQLY